MDRNPATSAGDAGLIPGPERSHTPRGNWVHSPQLLSPWAATTKPGCFKPVLRSKGAAAVRSPTLQRESGPNTAVKTQGSKSKQHVIFKKSLKWTKTKQKVLHSWLRIGSNRKRTFEIRRKHIKAIVAKPKDLIEVLGERLRECTRKKGMWS